MDALENLQDMFSSMNGDVVALVFRECNKDGERTLLLFVM